MEQRVQGLQRRVAGAEAWQSGKSPGEESGRHVMSQLNDLLGLFNLAGPLCGDQ